MKTHLQTKEKLAAAFTVLLFFVFAGGCFKDIPQKKVVYENNFEDSSMRNIEIYDPQGRANYYKVIPYNGSAVLGNFNGRLVRVILDNLPSHNTIEIKFDLYIQDQWDGDYIRPGFSIPDVWNMSIDNYPIYATTFSNTTHNQSFPNNYTGTVSINPPRSNAWDLTPGVCSGAGKKDGSSHYIIEYITSHSSNNMILDMNDALQPYNELCLKSWSIDNIKITAVTR